MSLSGTVSEINILLSSFLYADDAIQKTKSIVGLTRVEISNLDCWDSFLYVYRRTDLLYTENDCAYTYIIVPK